jgi:hypothetical protein
MKPRILVLQQQRRLLHQHGVIEFLDLLDQRRQTIESFAYVHGTTVRKHTHHPSEANHRLTKLLQCRHR